MSTEKSDLKYDCTASSPFKYHLNTKHENPFDHLFVRSFRFARLIQCLMSLGYFLDVKVVIVLQSLPKKNGSPT